MFMRKSLYGILILLIGFLVFTHDSLSRGNSRLPVFPGAEGFGTETPAGRGGEIIKVTNLNNSGAGSLRAAIDASGSRIVVFEVSGTIKLFSPLTIKNPYITIAGQTAPSPGICIRDGFLRIRTHDVLVQHLRFRAGDKGTKLAIRDGIQIQYSKSYRVVIDHCSVSWAIDENICINTEAHDVTVSNCIISEGLHHSYNRKGPHSKAFLNGDNVKNASLIRNLVAHNDDRHPNIKGGNTSISVNNLWYNAGYRWVSISDPGNNGPQKFTSIGDVYLNGRNTMGDAIYKIHHSVKEGTQIYIENTIHSGRLLTNGATFNPIVTSPPIWHSSIKVVAGEKVEKLLLANSGARPADRDAVDERIVNEVITRTGRIINSPSEVGGWPKLEKKYRKFSIPANPHGDFDGDGYTNIEEIIHSMAAKLEKKNNG